MFKVVFLNQSSRIKRLSPIACLLLLTSVAFAEPGVLVPEATFNFGKAPQRSTVSHTFWIKSTGSDTLRVETIVPGCGCTQVPLKDSVLAPGDSASFEILFSTKSFRGFVSKKPYLTTNAGEERIYVRIHAEVIPEPEKMKPVRMNPYMLDVSQFTSEPRRRARAWVVNQSENDLELFLIDDFGKDFKVELPKIVKAKDSAELMITVNEDAVEKEFNQSFTFEINDESRTRFSLPIQRMYRAPREKGEK